MKLRKVKKAYNNCIWDSNYKVYYLGRRETKAHRWLNNHQEMLKTLIFKEFGDFAFENGNIGLIDIINILETI